MAIELPPWLTRQYDYASGIRRTGQQIVENLQRNKQIETQAVHAAAQAEQARALEGWRVAQTQALQEKSQRDAEAESRRLLAIGDYQTDLDTLPKDAPTSDRIRMLFKHLPKISGSMSGLPSILGQELQNERSQQQSEDRKTLERGKGEMRQTLEETKQQGALDRLQKRNELLKAGSLRVEPIKGKPGKTAVWMEGSKQVHILKDDDWDIEDTITLKDHNAKISKLEVALTKAPRLPEGSFTVERNDILKSLNRAIADRESFLKNRHEEEPNTETTPPKRIRVKGPNGVGTVPEGTNLPEGWTVIE